MAWSPRPGAMGGRWADTDRVAFFEGFRGALAWCDVAATRTDKLDHKYGVRYWKDECSAWCRAQGLEAPYSVGAFMAAAVACRVKYSPLKNFPHDLAIGVAHYGRIVRGEWRRVLQRSGRAGSSIECSLKPSPRHVRYRESPVRIGFSF